MEMDMEHVLNDDCIFCKIIKGDIPSRTVYEDDDYKAILDVSPASRGHVIILPKHHVANVFEADEEVYAGAVKAAKKIATALKKVFNCDGINILQNNGEVAGQTVFHFHMHLIPRYEDDDQPIQMKSGEASAEELDAVKAQILGE